MSFADCVETIRAAAGRDLSDDELDQLAEEIDRIVKRRQADTELDRFQDQVAQDAADLADQWTAAAQQEKRQRAINRLREQELLTQIERVGDPALGLEAVMVGINRPIDGGRLSVDARSKALELEYLGGMVADLERAGLMPYWTSKAYGRQIAQELWEIGREGGRPGVSGSKQAREIAGIVHKYQSAAVDRQNRAGAWIVPRAGYIVRQTHDVAALRREGFDAWRDAILPRLDLDETFQGAEQGAFLRGAYDGLVTGRHGRADGAVESDDSGFRMPPNLANRVSAPRVLHFKSADDWFDYNQRFGTGDLSESVHWGLRRAAQNGALMESFGPNPGAMFQRVRNQLLNRHRGDAKTFDRIGRKALDNQFAEITGESTIPENVTAARIGAGVRAWQSMSKLGAAVISSVTDISSAAAELRYQGVGLLSAYGNQLEALVKGRRRSNAEEQQILDLINTGIEGMLGEAVARFSAQDHIPGRMAKLQTAFFRLNGLSWWTDSHKAAAGMMMARWLGQNADRALAEVPERLGTLLRQYGIDDATWDALRSVDLRQANGLNYLTPDMAREIPEERIAALLDGRPSARRIAEKRQQIETSLRAYLVDRADFAVPTPGARERAILRQGLQPGTVEGEAIRFFMQFKAFPVTVLTKPLGRELYGSGAQTLRQALFQGKGDMLGLAHYIAATTAMGYVAMAAKDMLKGRSPRDPEAPATWGAAFVQGGGAGIFGDFLFGNYNRFGGSLPETLAGPTVSGVGDFARAFAQFRSGDDGSATLMRAVVSNTPFANLFYTRIALDYLVLYQISEMLNPGYLRRMERRVQEDNAQTFMLRPSQAIPRGGGDRVFEGVR